MDETRAHEIYQAAWQAHRNSRHEEAMSFLEQAISMTACSKVKSTYLATKGGFLCRNKDYDKAVAACGEAVALESKNYYAHSQMGIAHLKMGNYSTAAKSFQSAAELRPDHNIWTLLAMSQLPNNPSAAKVSAKKALELEPSWTEARTVLSAAENAEKKGCQEP